MDDDDVTMAALDHPMGEEDPLHPPPPPPPGSEASLRTLFPENEPVDMAVLQELMTCAASGSRPSIQYPTHPASQVAFLLLLSPDGRVQYASEGVERKLGFRQDDFMSHSVYDAVAIGDHGRLQRMGVKSDGEAFRSERFRCSFITRMRPDAAGHEVPFEISALRCSPAPDPSSFYSNTNDVIVAIARNIADEQSNTITANVVVDDERGIVSNIYTRNCSPALQHTFMMLLNRPIGEFIPPGPDLDAIFRGQMDSHLDLDLLVLDKQIHVSVTSQRSSANGKTRIECTVAWCAERKMSSTSLPSTSMAPMQMMPPPGYEFASSRHPGMMRGPMMMGPPGSSMMPPGMVLQGVVPHPQTLAQEDVLSMVCSSAFGDENMNMQQPPDDGASGSGGKGKKKGAAAGPKKPSKPRVRKTAAGPPGTPGGPPPPPPVQGSPVVTSTTNDDKTSVLKTLLSHPRESLPVEMQGNPAYFNSHPGMYHQAAGGAGVAAAQQQPQQPQQQAMYAHQQAQAHQAQAQAQAQQQQGYMMEMQQQQQGQGGGPQGQPGQGQPGGWHGQLSNGMTAAQMQYYQQQQQMQHYQQQHMGAQQQALPAQPTPPAASSAKQPKKRKAPNPDKPPTKAQQAKLQQAALQQQQEIAAAQAAQARQMQLIQMQQQHQAYYQQQHMLSADGQTMMQAGMEYRYEGHHPQQIAAMQQHPSHQAQVQHAQWQHMMAAQQPSSMSSMAGHPQMQMTQQTAAASGPTSQTTPSAAAPTQTKDVKLELRNTLQARQFHGQQRPSPMTPSTAANPMDNAVNSVGSTGSTAASTASFDGLDADISDLELIDFNIGNGNGCRFDIDDMYTVNYVKKLIS